jgi:short-subunit dehydrogenase
MPKILILGATSGIAQRVAHLMAHRGDELFLVARNTERLETLAADLRIRTPSRIHIATADLDLTESHSALIGRVLEEMGQVDTALIAHGLLGDQCVTQREYSEAARLFRTNLLSPVSLLTLLGEYFEDRRAGVLAVLSSVAGDRGRQSNYVYGASKAALSVFAEGMCNRLFRSGVRVLTIKLGMVRTPMTMHLPPSPLFSDPDVVAGAIVRALDARNGEVYVPRYWWVIMKVICALPGFVFNRLRL